MVPAGIVPSRLAIMSTVSVTPVFEVRGITKVYQQGEVQVHALRGIDLELA